MVMHVTHMSWWHHCRSRAWLHACVTLTVYLQLTGTVPAFLSIITSLVELELESNMVCSTAIVGSWHCVIDWTFCCCCCCAQNSSGCMCNLAVLHAYLLHLKCCIMQPQLRNAWLQLTLVLGHDNISSAVALSLVHVGCTEWQDCLQLTGTIPAELSIMPNLTSIRFENNLMTGTIPQSFR